jgi:predicted ribosomally synthesized peptide with SipW-like signal peptide
MSSGRNLERSDEMVLVPARTLRMSRIRKAIVGVSLLGTVGVLAGTGTFASFSASTTNSGNVFSTGKLELSNTKQSGTACLSGYSGPGTGSPQSNLDSNGNSSCDTLFNLTLNSPGDTATANLAIANTGNYDGKLQFWLANGCQNQTVATPAGSSNLCGKLEVYIQEMTSSSYATPTSSCVFPAAGSACNTSWSASSDSLTDLATAATASSPFPGTALDLPKTGATTRYFQIKLNFGDVGFDANGNGLDNAYQNRRAAFDLVWRLQEA